MQSFSNTNTAIIHHYYMTVLCRVRTTTISNNRIVSTVTFKQCTKHVAVQFELTIAWYNEHIIIEDLSTDLVPELTLETGGIGSGVVVLEPVLCKTSLHKKSF